MSVPRSEGPQVGDAVALTTFGTIVHIDASGELVIRLDGGDELRRRPARDVTVLSRIIESENRDGAR